MKHHFPKVLPFLGKRWQKKVMDSHTTISDHPREKITWMTAPGHSPVPRLGQLSPGTSAALPGEVSSVTERDVPSTTPTRSPQSLCEQGSAQNDLACVYSPDLE